MAPGSSTYSTYRRQRCAAAGQSRHVGHRASTAEVRREAVQVDVRHEPVILIAPRELLLPRRLLRLGIEHDDVILVARVVPRAMANHPHRRAVLETRTDDHRLVT